MSDNPGIGKQVASSVVCTTHDCFILSSLPRSCFWDTYCNSILWRFVKADVKQAEQQESALGLSMS